MDELCKKTVSSLPLNPAYLYWPAMGSIAASNDPTYASSRNFLTKKHKYIKFLFYLQYIGDMRFRQQQK